MTHKSININKIDELIFSGHAFDLSLAEQTAMGDELFRTAFSDYVERCPQYRDLVKSSDIRVDNVAYFPKIPTSAFKLTHVLNQSADDAIEKWCKSSGTSGVQSHVPRNRITLDRLLGSVQSSLSLLREWSEYELEVIHLGPKNEDAGDIWFPYVMSLTELLYPTKSFMENGSIKLQEVINSLQELLSTTDSHIGIIGPPFMVLQLCQLIASQNISIGGKDRFTVVTAGGWKRKAGYMIPRDQFIQYVCSALQLASPSQIRDAFNQVELNTLIMECENHVKHVPPWVFAHTLSPFDLRPLADGEVGLLGYIDASCDSYPGIIISDDLGVVRRGKCQCGREGVFMDIIRRVERGYQGGCALALDSIALGS